jgi:hypothetical protein
VLQTIKSLELRDLRTEAGTDGDGTTQEYAYSADMVYRYGFGRWWGPVDMSRTAVWVLLNPATGDTELRRRPTLDRCVSWTRASGFSGLVIVNLFAYRHTDPRTLRVVDDPTGPHNDDVLRAVTKAGARTIVAWGAHGRLRGRSTQVAPVLDSPMCLGTTRKGEPRHPLYVPAQTPLTPWVPPTGSPPRGRRDGSPLAAG